MRFRKPCNFDCNAKLPNTDYNESNKLNLKSLAHLRSEKSLVKLGVPKKMSSRENQCQKFSDGNIENFFVSIFF